MGRKARGIDLGLARIALPLTRAHQSQGGRAVGFLRRVQDAVHLPKPSYSVVTQMTSGAPYGPNISLDGLHPTAAGHTIIAQAALRAIDDRYNVGVDEVQFGISTSPSIRNP